MCVIVYICIEHMDTFSCFSEGIQHVVFLLVKLSSRWFRVRTRQLQDKNIVYFQNKVAIKSFRNNQIQDHIDSSTGIGIITVTHVYTRVLILQTATRSTLNANYVIYRDKEHVSCVIKSCHVVLFI
jgi:hypothetical protein